MMLNYNYVSMSEDYHVPLCTACYACRVEPKRATMRQPTCMACGEKIARSRKFTVAPMHKSNYVLVTNLADLEGINNKGGNVH